MRCLYIFISEVRSLTRPPPTVPFLSQLAGIISGGDPVDALTQVGAQVAGAMFAHHFAAMDFGNNGATVAQFMGCFLLFSGLNAAGSNFDKAVAFCVAASCYGGTLNPALTLANAFTSGSFTPDAGLFVTVAAQAAGAWAAGKVKDFCDA